MMEDCKHFSLLNIQGVREKFIKERAIAACGLQRVLWSNTQWLLFTDISGNPEEINLLLLLVRHLNMDTVRGAPETIIIVTSETTGQDHPFISADSSFWKTPNDLLKYFSH